MESLKELDTVAKNGVGKVQTDLQTAADKIMTAAEEAKQAAQQAKAALLPGDLNVTVNGDFDGNLVVLVDQAKRHDRAVMKNSPCAASCRGRANSRSKPRKASRRSICQRRWRQNYTITLP